MINMESADLRAPKQRRPTGVRRLTFGVLWLWTMANVTASLAQTSSGVDRLQWNRDPGTTLRFRDAGQPITSAAKSPSDRSGGAVVVRQKEPPGEAYAEGPDEPIGAPSQTAPIASGPAPLSVLQESVEDDPRLRLRQPSIALGDGPWFRFRQPFLAGTPAKGNDSTACAPEGRPLVTLRAGRAQPSVSPLAPAATDLVAAEAVPMPGQRVSANRRGLSNNKLGSRMEAKESQRPWVP